MSTWCCLAVASSPSLHAKAHLVASALPQLPPLFTDKGRGLLRRPAASHHVMIRICFRVPTVCACWSTSLASIVAEEASIQLLSQPLSLGAFTSIVVQNE